MAYQRLLEAMRHLNLGIHRLMNDRMRAQGASLAQFKLLMFIERSGVARSVDISDAFGHAPRTVTEAVDALERDGLVVRTPDPNDRRAKHISITQAGRAVIREVDPYREAFTNQLFEILTPTDQDDLQRLLDILNARLVEMGAPDPYAQEQPRSTPSAQQQDDAQGQ